MGFNKREFADLLLRAKGDRSINRYASESDLSPAHISRLLRRLLDTAPSPETIAKLSKAACNGVTYESFMAAAGYIDENDIASEGAIRDMTLERKFHSIITPYLITHGKIKSINFPEKGKDYFDLIVELQEGTTRRWYLQFKYNLKRHAILSFLGYLTLQQFKEDEKITVVVPSERDFRIVVECKPLALKVNLYVMLIDLGTLEVVKEEVLCHV